MTQVDDDSMTQARRARPTSTTVYGKQRGQEGRRRHRAVKGRASVLVVLGVGVEVERTWFCLSVLALMLRHRSCTHPHCVCRF